MRLIIYLIGPDGSGKTTLAKALAQRMLKQGFKVKVSYMRGMHTFAAFLGKLFSKISSFRGSNVPGYNISISARLRRLWQIVEFVSLIPIFLFRYYLPSLLGYIVIGDRGPLDSLVWIMLVTNDEDYLAKIGARFLLALTSKNSVTIYVTAGFTTLIKRKKDTSHIFVAKEVKLYSLIITRIPNIQVIDTTNRSINDCVNDLMERLF
jgi:GTPase SAR1 family protein